MHYRRILLKLSGEALAGSRGFGLDEAVLGTVAEKIKRVRDAGVQVGVVIGGGNFLRGAQAAGVIDRVSSDAMGMLATVMNSLAFRAVLRARGVPCTVMSALAVQGVVPPVDAAEAVRLLDNGEVVVFAGGTGNPFFSTDTCAALRALEIGAEVLVKATKVNGIYDRDPVLHEGAVFLAELDYDEVLEKRLAVMDATAVSLCREHGLELRVLNIFETGALERAVAGERVGSVVRGRSKSRG